MSAIDDLDFAAKIHSSTAQARRASTAALARSRARRAAGAAGAARASNSSSSPAAANASAVIEPEIAERLIGPLVLAVIERAEPGERLRMSVERGDGDAGRDLAAGGAAR